MKPRTFDIEISKYCVKVRKTIDDHRPYCYVIIPKYVKMFEDSIKENEYEDKFE